MFNKWAGLLATIRVNVEVHSRQWRERSYVRVHLSVLARRCGPNWHSQAKPVLCLCYSRLPIIWAIGDQQNFNTLGWISLDKQTGHICITTHMTNKRELLWASDWSTISYLIKIFLWLPFWQKALSFLGKQRPVFVVLKYSLGGLNHGHDRWKSASTTFSRSRLSDWSQEWFYLPSVLIFHTVTQCTTAFPASLS